MGAMETRGTAWQQHSAQGERDRRMRVSLAAVLYGACLHLAGRTASGPGA